MRMERSPLAPTPRLGMFPARMTMVRLFYHWACILLQQVCDVIQSLRHWKLLLNGNCGGSWSSFTSERKAFFYGAFVLATLLRHVLDVGQLSSAWGWQLHWKYQEIRRQQLCHIWIYGSWLSTLHFLECSWIAHAFFDGASANELSCIIVHFFRKRNVRESARFLF